MTKSILLMFDIDGTLTEARKSIQPEMKETLLEVRKRGVKIAAVGGSDFHKQQEQLGEDCLEYFDYNFAENGLIAYQNGQLFHKKQWIDYIGEEGNTELINFVLRLFADCTYPIKRGTFVEYRSGMLNISPIGRQCSQKERDDFYAYDNEHGLRKGMVQKLVEAFGEKYNLQFSIGGQISVDVFPKGWDKTYSLQFVEKDFDEIHFFGDKTSEGGNDFEIFTDPRTIGHPVSTYHDTIQYLKEHYLK